MSKVDWAMVAVGAVIMVATSADVVPGDEVVGVPLGAALIAHGVGLI